MVDRGWGRIANIGSLASLLVATPSETTYSGIKALVLRFSETIDAEFRDAGIRCTVSLPGATEPKSSVRQMDWVVSNKIEFSAH
ncbi:SDR family NAD(P)-dependent oxidoreductase [Mycobacterium parmense]|uniref:Uncharacterized protein n=1 Tax=Mycobacterium parmense TaxID=185642 RepID=A0A7I7YQC9_9MYCO|nr:SDR family NAD(P)-dependent oxidoreductase [Mycobacterium parmense]MCV7353625.1 SDR family NAD(P)-dependent oxidoreductase [Mycobacterium parmense]ORW60106.1 hypothetical protein AWC20_09175 [Mycobacterium parmense]BBZ43372.1 hypothetical protein MPRM_06530 [Mycobacterium parmense]